MKRIISVLLFGFIVLCLTFAGAMANTDAKVTLKSRVPQGEGLPDPPEGAVVIRGEGFYFYFHAQGDFPIVGERNTITLISDSPYEGGYLYLDVFYTGAEDLSNPSDPEVSMKVRGAHSVSIDANPWVLDNKTGVFNDIFASVDVVEVPIEGMTVTSKKAASPSSAAFDVSIRDNRTYINVKVGTFVLNWLRKPLPAGDYHASLIVRIEGI